MALNTTAPRKSAENKVCLWKKILINPNNTTTKDSSPEQIAQCTNCLGCPNSSVCISCHNYLEISE